MSEKDEEISLFQDDLPNLGFDDIIKDITDNTSSYNEAHYARLKEIKALCDKVKDIKDTINTSIAGLTTRIADINAVLFHKNCYWDGYWWDSDGAWYDEEGKKHSRDGSVIATNGEYRNGLWYTGDGYYYAANGTKTIAVNYPCYYNDMWYDENGSYYDKNGYRHDLDGATTYLGEAYYIYTYDGYFCDSEGYYYDSNGARARYKWNVQLVTFADDTP